MADKEMRKFKISSYIENLDSAGVPEGDGEKTESMPSGDIVFEGKNAFISYTEESESGRITSEITVKENTVTVRRSGAIISEMVFSEGECHRSLYQIPPYSFDTVVNTKKIRNTLSKEGGRLDIFYTMSIGGQEKKVRMKIEV